MVLSTVLAGMMKLLVFGILAVTVCHASLRSMLVGNHEPLGVIGDDDPGDPLFLTPLINNGEVDKARAMSKVPDLDGVGVTSYAGYLTVNASCNSNMYFWFFPALNNDTKAPVLLWLQGGPGGTSMFGLFNEHGPIMVDKDGKLQRRPITWAQKYSMVYIDNPVGTGFSFTQKDECYARNEDDVARDLYNALSQFFTVFSDYQPNDFYATGESYAGKYVPAISYKIHQENQGSPAVKINLKGVIIGDGLCDPESMFPAYAPFMFNVGLLDENQRDYFAKYAALAVADIRAKNFASAFKIFDDLLNGDLTGYKAWFYNQTGLDFYFNYLLTTQPVEFTYYNSYIIKDYVRKSIHVGDMPFNSGNKVSYPTSIS